MYHIQFNKIYIFKFLIFNASVLVWWYASGYFPFTLPVAAGWVLWAWSLSMRSGQLPDDRHACAALLAAVAALWMPSRTLHLFVTGFTGIFAWETATGQRVRWYPAILLGLVSALLSNWILVFGFPIRLWLSEVAASVLHRLGADAYAEGNIIHYNGLVYGVDTACLGLVSVQISLLFLTGVLMLEEKRSRRYLPWWMAAALFAVTGGLIILYNLWRILLLCIFHLLPGTWGHEAGGLLSLVFFVGVPVVFLVRFARHVSGRPFSLATTSGRPPASNRSWYVLLALSAIVVWILATQTRRTLHEKEIVDNPLLLNLDTTVYAVRHSEHSITQYYGDSLLIYTKPIVNAFGAEHTPMICWQGSGFDFESGDQARLPTGEAYYTGVLIKKGEKGGAPEKLYTAWWYDNGGVATVSQWRWRQVALRDARPFSLVNVTASDPQRLRRGVGELLPRRTPDGGK